MKVVPTIAIGDLEAVGQASLQTGPFGTQLKASEYVADGIPVINVRNVGFGEVRKTDLEYVTEGKAEKLHQHRLQAGDIVFGRKGAVERHALIDRATEGWIQGSDCLRIRVTTNTVCEKYLSYYLRTSAHQDWMQALCSFGSTMASLNQDIVRRIRFPAPAPAVQKKIAAILSAYDDLIENNRRRIALLERMAEEIYREWFVRLRFPGHEQAKFEKGIPVGWSYGELRDIALESSRSTRSGNHLSGRLYVPLDLLATREMIPADHQDFTEAQSSLVTFEDDDILFGAMRPYLHKVALAPFKGITRTTCFVIRPKTPDAHAFLFLTLFQPSSIDYASMICNGADRPYVVWNRGMEKMGVLCPDGDTLQRFEEAVGPILDRVKKSYFFLRHLMASRDALLPRLISGKLPVDTLDIHFPPSMQLE